MTKLKMLNVFVVQWFFIRICRFMNDDGIQNGWGFLFPVLPLTGWRTDYIPKKRFTIKIFEWRV